MNPFKLRLSCTALALLLCLTGCSDKEQPSESPASSPAATRPAATQSAETTAPEETVSPESVEELTVVLTEGEMYILNQYTNLKTLDLSGSTCYEAILKYIDRHPEVKVTYTVPLGSAEVRNTETSITLSPDEIDYDEMLENLQFLPNLTEITLTDVSLSAEQITLLEQTYPGLFLSYTVELFGNSYTPETAELDLTGMTSSQVDEAVSKLGLLTGLTDVQLSSALSMEDVAKLQDSNPNATFHYTFTLFGKTLSTTDEEVEFTQYSIGNEGEEEIRKALAILDNCSRFLLDRCGLDNEVLAQIREDFRDGPKVVWRVYFGVDSRYNLLTDADTLRAVYNVTDETCSAMRYCEDVKYMDIGHNETLTDLSFIGYMPNIEVVIASGCAVKELVGLENCKKLTWLELAYCYKLTNIDCLSECESLTYLNLSFSKVSNYMPLDSLPLKRFVCLSPKASTAEQNTFVGIHSDCLTVFYGYSNPYGYGWRYDDNGKTFNEYYKNVVRVAFNYDYLEQFLPKDED